MGKIDEIRNDFKLKYGEGTQKFTHLNMNLSGIQEAIGKLAQHGEFFVLERGREITQVFQEWPKMFRRETGKDKDGNPTYEHLVVHSPETAANLSEGWSDEHVPKEGEAGQAEGIKLPPPPPGLLGVDEQGRPAMTDTATHEASAPEEAESHVAE